MSLDLRDAAFIADPYPTWSRIRAEDPVYWSDKHRSWFLTRHEDCEAFFHDEALTADRAKAAKGGGRGGPPGGFRSIGSDPPEHTAVRRLAQRGFTARETEALRPRIEAMVTRLLEQLPATFDLITDFAYPLPITVIAELFGVPEADRAQFTEWSRQMAAGMDRFYSKEAGFGGGGMGQYIAGLVAERQRRPGDDLISLMLEADEDDALTPLEVTSLCTILVFAGHETTTNLIGNGILALLRSPDQLDAVRKADAAGIRTAVEELLRFDSPAQMINRAARTGTTIGGTTIAAGDSVVAVLGAANRDPARFADADVLDVGRHPNPHLAFGQGVHFCLGASLSRREAQIAVPALLEHCRDLQLAAAPRFRPTAVLRGLESLPLSAA